MSLDCDASSSRFELDEDGTSDLLSGCGWWSCIELVDFIALDCLKTLLELAGLDDDRDEVSESSSEGSIDWRLLAGEECDKPSPESRPLLRRNSCPWR